MKGRTGRKDGGPTSGVDEAAEDQRLHVNMRTHAPDIERDARERKKGGRVARKRGGKAPAALAIGGAPGRTDAGVKPRKAGGRTGSNDRPFSSARHGKDPPGHSTPGGTTP